MSTGGMTGKIEMNISDGSAFKILHCVEKNKLKIYASITSDGFMFYAVKWKIVMLEWIH